MIRVELEQKTLGNLDKEFRASVNRIFNEAANDAVRELKAVSPVGATRELQEGWNYIPARRQTVTFDTEVKIINDADNAYFRIFGRAPGIMPPLEPIERWVDAKLPISAESSGASRKKVVRARAYLIARKIGREGTERYKENSNPFGLTRDGGFIDGSILDKTQKRIATSLQSLQFG